MGRRAALTLAALIVAHRFKLTAVVSFNGGGLTVRRRRAFTLRWAGEPMGAGEVAPRFR